MVWLTIVLLAVMLIISWQGYLHMGLAGCMRPGITSCVIKPAATYAEAAARFHSPAASAGA